MKYGSPSTRADWWETLDARHRAKRQRNGRGGPGLEHYQACARGRPLQGNSSYNHPGRKKPFRIDFDKFVKDQKIGDISSLSLGNNWGDPSFVREELLL